MLKNYLADDIPNKIEIKSWFFYWCCTVLYVILNPTPAPRVDQILSSRPYGFVTVLRVDVKKIGLRCLESNEIEPLASNDLSQLGDSKLSLVRCRRL